MVLGVLLEQPVDVPSPPSLPRFPPADRREFSELQKDPWRKRLTPLKSPSLVTRLSPPQPEPEILPPGRAGPGSVSCQQPRCWYPVRASLSLQGLEETLPHIDVTCEFSTPS